MGEREMTSAAEALPSTDAPADARLFGRCHAALTAADALVSRMAATLADSLRGPDGRLEAAAIDARQFAVHGYAWYATYVEALRQTLAWAEALAAGGRFGEAEELILTLGFGEYLRQMAGGIAMTQVEIVRPEDLGLDRSALSAFWTPEVAALAAAAGPEARTRLAELISHGLDTGDFGAWGLDETLNMVRDQFRRFVEAEVAPHAHGWHLRDELIPIEVVEQMGELGVFGLTIPEAHGGLAMGKIAMCVVSEELSRGYIGVGSLGTRSEIAGELILAHGTDDQKARWLAGLASGEILPTAVFTEPNTGSDLGALRTRAVREGDSYRISGNKTWITHAARTDMMTLLARTDPDTTDYRGLSMFIAEKPRGSDADPFPAPGMTGGEIPVLGYRGMKEYELAFDGFEVSADHLLGHREGQGFKQLMATFESARIQTAARALGVGQSALEIGLRYALDRRQFGRAIFDFPRVHGKLAWMAVELMMTRQLTFFAARQKDSGKRCDLEAGMAKLLGARVAWANADNALQIHGGNGFALEYPISRVLCDARILNIFEGAGEIQAQVIARRLLEARNG